MPYVHVCAGAQLFFFFFCATFPLFIFSHLFLQFCNSLKGDIS